MNKILITAKLVFDDYCLRGAGPGAVRRRIKNLKGLALRLDGGRGKSRLREQPLWLLLHDFRECRSFPQLDRFTLSCFASQLLCYVIIGPHMAYFFDVGGRLLATFEPKRLESSLYTPA